MSNTLTLRKFFIWNSRWFCDFNYYNLLFEDLKITNYLQSICRYLKYPSSNFIIKRSSYKIIIYSNIHLMSIFYNFMKKTNKLFFFQNYNNVLINNLFFKKSVYYVFRKVSLKIHLFLLKQNTVYNSVNSVIISKSYNNNSNRYSISKKIYSLILKNISFFRNSLHIFSLLYSKYYFFTKYLCNNYSNKIIQTNVSYEILLFVSDTNSIYYSTIYKTLNKNIKYLNRIGNSYLGTSFVLQKKAVRLLKNSILITKNTFLNNLFASRIYMYLLFFFNITMQYYSTSLLFFNLLVMYNKIVSISSYNKTNISSFKYFLHNEQLHYLNIVHNKSLSYLKHLYYLKTYLFGFLNKLDNKYTFNSVINKESHTFKNQYRMLFYIKYLIGLDSTHTKKSKKTNANLKVSYRLKKTNKIIFLTKNSNFFKNNIVSISKYKNVFINWCIFLKKYQNTYYKYLFFNTFYDNTKHINYTYLKKFYNFYNYSLITYRIYKLYKSFFIKKKKYDIKGNICFYRLSRHNSRKNKMYVVKFKKFVYIYRYKQKKKYLSNKISYKNNANVFSFIMLKVREVETSCSFFYMLLNKMLYFNVYTMVNKTSSYESHNKLLFTRFFNKWKSIFSKQRIKNSHILKKRINKLCTRYNNNNKKGIISKKKYNSAIISSRTYCNVIKKYKKNKHNNTYKKKSNAHFSKYKYKYNNNINYNPNSKRSSYAGNNNHNNYRYSSQYTSYNKKNTYDHLNYKNNNIKKNKLFDNKYNNIKKNNIYFDSKYKQNSRRKTFSGFNNIKKKYNTDIKKNINNYLKKNINRKLNYNNKKEVFQFKYIPYDVTKIKKTVVKDTMNQYFHKTVLPILQSKRRTFYNNDTENKVNRNIVLSNLFQNYLNYLLITIPHVSTYYIKLIVKNILFFTINFNIIISYFYNCNTLFKINNYYTLLKNLIVFFFNKKKLTKNIKLNCHNININTKYNFSYNINKKVYYLLYLLNITHYFKTVHVLPLHSTFFQSNDINSFIKYKYVLLDYKHTKSKYIFRKYISDKKKIFKCKEQIFNNPHASDDSFVSYLSYYYLTSKNKLYNYSTNLLLLFYNLKGNNRLNIIKKSMLLKKKFLQNLRFNRNKYVNKLNTNVFITNNKVVYYFLYNNTTTFYSNIHYITSIYKYLKKMFKVKYTLNLSISFLLWYNKLIIVKLIGKLIYIFKYIFTLNIKQSLINNKYNSNNVILLNAYSYFINTFINKNTLQDYIAYNLNLYNIFVYYKKHCYRIDYVNDYMFFSILKIRTFFYYCLRYYIFCFLYLFSNIERTITSYSNKQCFVFIRYSLNSNNYINSAKMWCEYMVYQLKKKISIRKIFWYIKKQQLKEQREYNSIMSSEKHVTKYLIRFKYPLKGIRILYSGNFKKAKRKKKLYYYIWLANFKLSSKMPIQQFKYYIDYYYSVVILKRSSIGLKFWLIYNTY